MVRAQRGDQEAFRTLVEQCQDKVFRLVIRVLHCDRSTAEDLAQEVFLRVYRGLNRFDGRAQFTTWLHTITMNVCISEYRKRHALKRGRRTLSLHPSVGGQQELAIDPPTPALGPGESAHHREFLGRVKEAVGELPDEFRDAVLLRDMQDLSYEQISEILGVPPGTVRSRIHRGRLILQEKLKGFVR
jgi:RNA polymerase sigma-70 factor (ECF subfamily)